MKRWFLLMLLLLASSQFTYAHPLDQLHHDMRVNLQPKQLVINVRIVAGPLITPRLWSDLDADNSQHLEETEIQAWCEKYATKLFLRVDSHDLAPAVTAIEPFPATKAAFIGDSATELRWTITASLPELPAGQYQLKLHGNAYPDISVYDWSKTRGVQGIVVKEGNLTAQNTMEFPIRWPSQFNAPLAAPTAETVPTIEAGTNAPAPLLQHLKQGPQSPLIVLWALLAAVVFGALHALQPGHGKTLVAAYLVGSRGTVRHAIILGGVVTLTHTLSVIILGVLVLMFSVWIRLEQIIPGLMLVSGLLVVAVGMGLLWERVRMATAGIAPHSHSGPDFDPTTHSHSHTALSDGRIISLGISGGIVPCPEALVILIVAATLGQLVLGLAMIIAFSLGLALVLIGIGLVLVMGGQRLWRHTERLGVLANWLPALSAALVVGLGIVLAWQGWNTF